MLLVVIGARIVDKIVMFYGAHLLSDFFMKGADD